MKCVNCNADIDDGQKFCSSCGTKQKKSRTKFSKKKLLGITSLSLVVVLIVILIIVAKVTTKYQDGVVTSMFGIEYYIPKTISQIDEDGDLDFNYEISTDEDSENYYLKEFNNSKESDDKLASNIYTLGEDKIVTKFRDVNYYFDYNGVLFKTETKSIDSYNIVRNNTFDYKYDGKGRFIQKDNGKKLSYDESDRIISDGSHERKYKENNSFTYVYNTDWWTSKGQYEVKYDEYNHIISVSENKGRNYQCEYEYDSNGCITSYKFIDTHGDIIIRKAEYQKVSKEDYINYMTVCAVQGFEDFYMPVDAIHSSLFLDIDPSDMVDYVD